MHRKNWHEKIEVEASSRNRFSKITSPECDTCSEMQGIHLGERLPRGDEKVGLGSLHVS